MTTGRVCQERRRPALQQQRRGLPADLWRGTRADLRRGTRADPRRGLRADLFLTCLLWLVCGCEDQGEIWAQRLSFANGTDGQTSAAETGVLAADTSAAETGVPAADTSSGASTDLGGDLLLGDMAASDTGQPCFGIPPQGCCDGQALWWCEDGRLRHQDCGRRPQCGWSNSGMFDCNTSGNSDPDGVFAKECRWLINDAGQPQLTPLDGSVPDGQSDPCGQVGRIGCCAGEVLLYCLEGQLQRLDCSLNTHCGWQPGGQYYDCGTQGFADPSGNHAQACPVPAPDGQPGGPFDLGPWPTPDTAPAVDGGDTVPKDPGGCSCEVGEDGPATSRFFGMAPWLLAAAVFFWRHQRKRKADSC